VLLCGHRKLCAPRSPAPGQRSVPHDIELGHGMYSLPCSRPGSDYCACMSPSRTQHLATLLATLYVIAFLAPVGDMLWPALHPPQALDFPCAMHGCGCQDATDCLARCCCFRGERAKPDALRSFWTCSGSSDDGSEHSAPALDTHLLAGWRPPSPWGHICRLPKRTGEKPVATNDPPEAVPIPAT